MTMPDEIAKVLHKETPHLIRITISPSSGEPVLFKYEVEEEHDGKKQWVTYKGNFTSRTWKPIEV